MGVEIQPQPSHPVSTAPPSGVVHFSYLRRALCRIAMAPGTLPANGKAQFVVSYIRPGNVDWTTFLIEKKAVHMKHD